MSLVEKFEAIFEVFKEKLIKVIERYESGLQAQLSQPVTELVIQQEFSAPVLSDAITLSYAINGKLSDPFVRYHRLRSSFYPYLFKIIPNEDRRIFDIQEYYFDFLRITWPPPYHMVRVYDFGEFSSLRESAG